MTNSQAAANTPTHACINIMSIYKIIYMYIYIYVYICIYVYMHAIAFMLTSI